jgi:integrase
MAIFRRGKWYWTDFSVNGQRFRQSLDTTDWREALSEEKRLIAQAQAGKLSATGQSFARIAFTEAVERYLDSRKLELSERSLKKERQLLVQPSLFFAATPLARITTENLLAYRESRAKKRAGPAYINMEMGTIRRILKRAKRWHIVAEDIRPLKERREVGRAMAHEEKVRLLRVAGMRPEWKVARCAAILALNTTMRGCELKGLRWRDVNLIDRMLTVRRSKTEAGERVIPLNSDAMAAILELYKRGQAVGATDLNHFVFPAC